jgi:hypothetical protein
VRAVVYSPRLILPLILFPLLSPLLEVQQKQQQLERIMMMMLKQRFLHDHVAWVCVLVVLALEDVYSTTNPWCECACTSLRIMIMIILP